MFLRRDVVFTLNLDDMQIPDTSKYSGARRLSNSNSWLQNPHFPCEWCVYWWSNIGWVEYLKVPVDLRFLALPSGVTSFLERTRR